VKNSTSDLLIENCDEFIFYEDLVRAQQRPLPVIANVPEKVAECFALLVDSVLALQRENKEVLWGSMVKETMKRKKPSFNETYYGFRTFSHLLEDAQRRGIVTLRRDQKSGSYIVEDLGAAANAPQVGLPGSSPPVSSAVAGAGTATTASSAAPAGASASGGVPAEGEATNGARTGPRRRRGGRGRRRPGQAPLAPGAPSDLSGGSSGSEYSDADDLHDGDDDGDDFTGDEPESPEGPAADGGPSSASPDAAPEPAPERGGFSLFGWMRRDSEEKKPQ
jgi:hypothetical protein